MSLIQELESSLETLNRAYDKELSTQFKVIRQSLPFELLLELRAEHGLQLDGREALIRAEVHDTRFTIPRLRTGVARVFNGWPHLNHKASIEYDEGGYVGNIQTDIDRPVTPFMKQVGIAYKYHWKDYYPSWEEYLEMLPENRQRAVLDRLNEYDLANMRYVRGQHCAALYWQKLDSSSVSKIYSSSISQIHSAWLGVKPRSEQSLKELIWSPKPETEDEWRNSISGRYNGQDI